MVTTAFFLTVAALWLVACAVAVPMLRDRETPRKAAKLLRDSAARRATHGGWQA